MLLDDLDPRLVNKIQPRLEKMIIMLDEEIGDPREWVHQRRLQAEAEGADHDDAQRYYMLGNLLSFEGEDDEAIEQYGKAIELEDRYVDARYALARQLNDQGHHEQALQELDKVREMDPWYLDAYWESAYALDLLGRDDEAAEMRHATTERSPSIKGRQDSAVEAEWEIEDAQRRRRGAAPPVPGLEETLSIGVEFTDELELDETAPSLQKMEASQRHARSSQEEFLKLLGELNIDQYESEWFINMVYVHVTLPQLVELLSALSGSIERYDVMLRRIDLSRLVEAMIHGAVLSEREVQALSSLSPVNVQSQPRSSARSVGADRLWARGLTGAGCRIAVIDTGICDEHPDLDPKRKVTFPPEAEFKLPYVYGEAIQGGNYVYDVSILPDLTQVEIELVTGLEYKHFQLQSGIHSAKLDVYIYEPDKNQPLEVVEQEEEADGVFFRKTYGFKPREAGGKYRIHIRGSDIDTNDTPWRGVLFKLSATDLTNYPGKILHFVSPCDDHGHGTHVAGIVAGTGESSNGAYKGLAPGASLVCAKVLGYQGTASDFDLMKTIRWAVSQGVDVLNLSFGSYDELCQGDCPACNAANRAVKEYRMVVVAAAGNLGPAQKTITCPGKAEHVITVGSCKLDGRVSNFSSRGPVDSGVPKPDLVAPGEGIISCLSVRHFVSVRTDNGNVVFEPLVPLPTNSSYIGLSGTSMSAPHVAGSVALLLQADRTLTPERIKHILVDTATPIPDFGEADQGKGMLNLEAALKAVPQVVVDTITTDQDTYPPDVREIDLQLKLRNNRADKAFQNLRVTLSIENQAREVVFDHRETNVQLAREEEKVLSIPWAVPGDLRAGQYQAMAEVGELILEFPEVVTGNVMVQRKVDHYLTDPTPVFRIGRPR
jgi:subtilisin family serine protease